MGTHQAPRLPAPHAPTAQFAAIAAWSHPVAFALPPPRRLKRKRRQPTDVPATMPKRSAYRAHGMDGSFWRSDTGWIVLSASM